VPTLFVATAGGQLTQLMDIAGRQYSRFVDRVRGDWGRVS